jgi:hypothetical protein
VVVVVWYSMQSTCIVMLQQRSRCSFSLVIINNLQKLL